jgi:hypothetical protein
MWDLLVKYNPNVDIIQDLLFVINSKKVSNNLNILGGGMVSFSISVEN